MVTVGSSFVRRAAFQHFGYDTDLTSLTKRSRHVCSLECEQLSSAPCCYFTDGLGIADIERLGSGADSLNQFGQRLTRPHFKEGSYTSGDHMSQQIAAIEQDGQSGLPIPPLLLPGQSMVGR